MPALCYTVSGQSDDNTNLTNLLYQNYDFLQQVRVVGEVRGLKSQKRQRQGDNHVHRPPGNRGATLSAIQGLSAAANGQAGK
jgi:hypothetical protein